MSVTFNEWGGSPKFKFGFAGHTAERKGTIAWGDIATFVSEIFPVSFTAGTEQFGGLGASFPGTLGAALRVDSMDVDPFPGEAIDGPDTTQDFDTVVTHEFALCTIRYTAPKFPDIEEDDPALLLTHRWSAGGEFITLPNGELQWASDSTAVGSEISPGRLVPTINHTVNWPHIEVPPFENIRAGLGTVNAAAFKMATGIAGAETLLFIGADLEREVMSDGARAWSVTYHFSEKRTEAADADPFGGWNHFWRNETSKVGFYRLETSGSAKIYPTSTFANLFETG